MRMSSRHGWAAAMVASLALVAACGGNDSDSTTTADASTDAGSGGKDYVIGLSNQTLAVTFPVAIGEGVRKAAEARGAKVVELDSKGDVAKQGSDIQDLISQGVDAILLVPNSPGPAQAMVDKAAAAGIPIGIVHGQAGEREPEDIYPKLDFIIGEDEVGAGGEAGKLAVEAMPDGGKVAVITGAAGFKENTTRVTKFKEALEASGKKFEIVATQPGDWTLEKGQSACQGILSANPDTELFYALSDDMAVGCQKAAQAAGSKAKIIGVGGSKSGIQAVKAGTLYGSVCFKPETSGEQAATMMLDILDKKVEAPKKTIFYETPAVSKATADQCTPQW